MEAPLIEIQDATIFRGDTKVFDRFSLCIEQHEQVAILGPNGCGKTTLLKTINRDLYPVIKDNSFVRILGRDHWNVWKLRSHIGLVSHDLQMRYTQSTTATEVVLSGFLSSVGIHGMLSQQISAEHRQRAVATLHDFGAADLAEIPLGKMSTGQQRRCLLARAMVHNPDTLILDEPTAGLDLTASFELMARIGRLISAGRNIVLVTHLLNEIPPAIERVVLLRAGEVVADGPKQAVLNERDLSETYSTPIRVSEVDGYYLATPG